VAFSPVLVNLASHLAAESWARYSLIFPPLLVWCALREREPPRASRDGFLWLALAIPLELLAVGSTMTTLARPGVPLAVIGTCRALGLTSGATALLALWMIPLPKFVSAFASPELETVLLRVAGAAVGLLGGEVSIEPSRAFAAGGELKVAHCDGGLPLAALLSGLGWYASLRAGAGLRACVRGAVTWGLLAFPLQALAVLLAVGMLVLGGPEVGRQLLSHGLWMAAAVAGLAWAERLRLREATRDGV
jgi:hypothetical protein